MVRDFKSVGINIEVDDWNMNTEQVNKCTSTVWVRLCEWMQGSVYVVVNV